MSVADLHLVLESAHGAHHHVSDVRADGFDKSSSFPVRHPAIDLDASAFNDINVDIQVFESLSKSATFSFNGNHTVADIDFNSGWDWNRVGFEDVLHLRHKLLQPFMS